MKTEKINKDYLYVGGAIIAGFAIWYFFIKDDKNKDVNAWINDGVPPSYTDSQYTNMANSLDSLLDEVSTDEESIYDIFSSMKNITDVLKLIANYGTHFHFGFGYVGNYTLPEFMALMLDADEIENINQILHSNNINYTF